MKYCTSFGIENHSIFESLPLEEKKELESKMIERTFKKGETVFRKGSIPEYVWLVKSGRVHLSHHFFQGFCQTVCVASRGDFFCCIPSLDLGRYTADALAAIDSILTGIPISSFHNLLGKHPRFLKDVLVFLCKRMRATEAKLCSQRVPVESRIAGVLIQLSPTYHDHIPMTRQEIADLAGTTVETTIRTLSDFRKKGWIHSRRGLIHVKNIRAIGALLHSD